MNVLDKLKKEIMQQLKLRYDEKRISEREYRLCADYINRCFEDVRKKIHIEINKAKEVGWFDRNSNGEKLRKRLAGEEK